jgi:hypothetical protein
VALKGDDVTETSVHREKFHNVRKVGTQSSSDDMVLYSCSRDAAPEYLGDSQFLNHSIATMLIPCNQMSKRSVSSDITLVLLPQVHDRRMDT